MLFYPHFQYELDTLEVKTLSSWMFKMSIYCKMLIKSLYSDHFVGADFNEIHASFVKQYDLKQIQPCYFCFTFNFSIEEILLP